MIGKYLNFRTGFIAQPTTEKVIRLSVTDNPGKHIGKIDQQPISHRNATDIKGSSFETFQEVAEASFLISVFGKIKKERLATVSLLSISDLASTGSITQRF